MGIWDAIVKSLRRKKFRKTPFSTSGDYWEGRCRAGGDSGRGSYSRLAGFKAEVINRVIAERGVESVIEFGSGDGNNLALYQCPRYTGFDVSHEAVRLCRERYAADSTKSFLHTDEYADHRADLTMSLDVVYHLVEDEVFHAYMRRLFDSAVRVVIVYASNTDENPEPRPPHVRHRRFTEWVEANAPGWRLAEHTPNRYPFNGDGQSTSFADFFIYERAE